MLISLFCCWAWGAGGSKRASLSRWRLRRKLSPSRPLLCIESVPVWLLPQFPPLLNIGPAVVVAGRVCPLVGSPLLSRFWRESLKVRLDYSSSRFTPNFKAPDVQTGTAIQRTRGHFWSTWAPCLRRHYVWSNLCSDHIRSLFRYQVNPPVNTLSLSLTAIIYHGNSPPLFSVGPSSSALRPSPGALCCGETRAAPLSPLFCTCWWLNWPLIPG